MRFLQIMLSIIWISFAWLCYSAVQWREPIRPPWHVESSLENIIEKAREKRINPEGVIDNDIAEYKFYISQTAIKGDERADAHAILSRSYWLKAYLQQSYLKQKSYLQLALNEMIYALDYYKSREFSSDRVISQKIAQYEYNTADLYHQLKQYPEAEKFYLQAMRRLPGNPIFYRRYTDMIEESGLPQKIDYDTYFRQEP